MKKKFSLSAKFIAFFTLSIIIVLLLAIIVTQVCSRVFVENSIRDSVYSLQDDIDEGVTEVIDEVAHFYSSVVSLGDSATLDAISTGRTETARLNALRDVTAVAGLSSLPMLDVGFRMGNEYLSVNAYSRPSDELFALAEGSPDNTLVLGDYKNSCITFAVKMNSERTVTRGTFVFYLLETSLSDVYSALSGEAGYSFIMTTDGYIMSHDDNSQVGKTLIFDHVFSLDSDGYQIAQINGAKSIVVRGSLDTLNAHYGFGCHLITILNYGYYYADFDRFTIIIAGVAAAVFVLGAILAVLRAKGVVKPIENLNTAVKNVIDTGEKSSPIATEGDELLELERNYDTMIDRIFDLMQKNKDEMEVQRKLELDALQMQINPHFLYNTLDAVVWMARIKKDKDIESLVVSLAQFFRLSLHRGDKFITIEEEVDIVKHYLEIESVRFPDRAVAEFDVSEDIKHYKTLKLILQPIVENTLKYAFPEGNGKIVVKAYAEKGDIVYIISDNGTGFNVPPDILKLRKKQYSGTGYGLFNVDERIRLEYGEGYGLKVESEIGKGTCVTVRIQKRI